MSKYTIQIDEGLKKINISMANSSMDNFYSTAKNKIHVNSIVGKNGAGKSTLLKFITCLKTDKIYSSKMVAIFEENNKLQIYNKSHLAINCSVEYKVISEEEIFKYNLIYFTNVLDLSDIKTTNLYNASLNSSINEHISDFRFYGSPKKIIPSFFSSYNSEEIFSRINFVINFQEYKEKLKFIPQYTTIKLKEIDENYLEKHITKDEKYILDNIINNTSNSIVGDSNKHDFIIELLLVILKLVVVNVKSKNIYKHNETYEFNLVSNDEEIEENQHDKKYNRSSANIDIGTINIKEELESLLNQTNELINRYNQENIYNSDMVDKFKNIIVEFIDNIVFLDLSKRYEYEDIDIFELKHFHPTNQQLEKLNHKTDLELDFYDLSEDEYDYKNEYSNYFQDDFENDLILYDLNEKGKRIFKFDTKDFEKNNLYKENIYVKMKQFIEIIYSNLSNYSFVRTDILKLNMEDSSFLHFINAYKKIVNEFNILELEWYNLSSGEEALINIYSRIYKALNHKNREYSKYIFLLDECDLFLHPLWQKGMVNNLLQFVNLIFSNCEVHIILTTHSPFILSDILKENVIFIEKDLESNLVCKIAKGLDKKQTFASNIHTLLTDSFFMNSTIGEFAKIEIEKVIKTLMEKLTNKLNVSDITELEKQNIKNIIEHIGEPILKNKLEKLLEEAFPDDLIAKNDEITQLKQEIEHLKIRINQYEK